MNLRTCVARSRFFDTPSPPRAQGSPPSGSRRGNIERNTDRPHEARIDYRVETPAGSLLCRKSADPVFALPEKLLLADSDFSRWKLFEINLRQLCQPVNCYRESFARQVSDYSFLFFSFFSSFSNKPVTRVPRESCVTSAHFSHDTPTKLRKLRDCSSSLNLQPSAIRRGSYERWKQRKERERERKKEKKNHLPGKCHFAVVSVRERILKSRPKAVLFAQILGYIRFPLNLNGGRIFKRRGNRYSWFVPRLSAKLC